MLVIRYQRIGKKNQPSFKIIVTDKRKSAAKGRSVEVLGFNNPLTKKNSVDKERALYWISKGAQPSASVHNLLVTLKIIEGKKVVVTMKKKPVEATPTAPVQPVAETAAAPAPEKPAEPVVKETPKEEEVKPA